MTGDRATATLDLLLEISTLLATDMRRDLQARGLTAARTHLLWVLHHAGPATQRGLADALQVSPRNVTGLVDALVDTGFVTRTPHPGDRRAVLVELTGKGRALTEGLVGEHRQLAGQLLGDLPAADLARLSAGLEHVADKLRPLVPGDEMGGHRA